jgi:hypothetical protein
MNDKVDAVHRALGWPVPNSNSRPATGLGVALGFPSVGACPGSAAFSAVASRICNTSRVPERIGPTALRVPTHLHPVCMGFRPFPDLLCRFSAFYGQIRPIPCPFCKIVGLFKLISQRIDRLAQGGGQDEGTAARQNHWAPALRRRMGASTSVSTGKSVIAAAASALSGLTPGSARLSPASAAALPSPRSPSPPALSSRRRAALSARQVSRLRSARDDP